MKEFFFSKVNGCKPATLLRNKLLHGSFSRILHCAKYARIRAFADRIFRHMDKILSVFPRKLTESQICSYAGVYLLRAQQ